MMELTDKFWRCHPFVQRMEGGLSDDAADAGGITNWGVCIVFLRDLADRRPGVLREIGIPMPVTREVIKGLTKAQAAQVFYAEMWEPAKCESLPLPVAFCLYDMAVNHGRAGAVRIAQRAANRIGMNLAVDGIIGPKTLDALARMATMNGINAIADEREDYYRRIILRKPSQKVFEKSWMRRAREMRAEVIGMLDEGLTCG